MQLSSIVKLEKESESETFKIRDENPWVTVEPNGAVRVKKRWDFEELGREKTIDFWVIISNVRSQSECSFKKDPMYISHFWSHSSLDNAFMALE